MQFKDVIGHEDVKQALRQSLRTGQVAHAQLFTGSRGVGKMQLALAYAQYNACEHPTDTDSCGHCPACLQYSKLQHPDLHFVFPIVEKGEVCDTFAPLFQQLILEKTYFDLNDWYFKLGVETKQGMIYEKESGEILRKLSLKAYGNGYKVMIIWLPEKMNTTAANKLLKILEEPPEKTIFLLVSEEPDQLLPTILSRVQQRPVGLLTEEQITTALNQRFNMSTEESQAVAHIAAGSWLKALQTINTSEDNNRMFASFQRLMRNAWLVGHKKQVDALLDMKKWSEEMAASTFGRERQKAFLQYAQRLVRENFIANYQQPKINYMTNAEQQFSSKFAPFINEHNVEQIMQQLTLAQRQIEQNGNAKMIFFDLSLQMILLIKRG